MPIAEVAGEAADRAALEDMAQALEAAEAEGRVVKRIPLDRISTQHLDRDRVHLDEDEMAVLQSSIAARGQQAPIEVLRLSGGGFGLISGLRRLVALQRLGETEALALIRQPDSAAAAHVAMVEENEVRSGLSFWERANVAVVATSNGVFPDLRMAIDTLFAHAPAPKRSKIARFAVLRQQFGKTLRFPTAIPEKLGLALAAAVEADKRVAVRLADAIRKTPPADAAAERRLIERALKGDPVTKPAAEEIAPGLRIETRKGRVVVSGPGVREPLVAALKDWLVSHAK